MENNDTTNYIGNEEEGRSEGGIVNTAVEGGIKQETIKMKADEVVLTDDEDEPDSR